MANSGYENHPNNIHHQTQQQNSNHHQQQHKISPRKFSEKIALLNKKEAEGNAEFEEIIKEVQATRSVNSMKIYKKSVIVDQNQQEKQQDELEEVFENLIKCVGQYEQDLQESQSVDYGQAACQNVEPLVVECLRSASVEPGERIPGACVNMNSNGLTQRASVIQTVSSLKLIDPYGGGGGGGVNSNNNNIPNYLATSGAPESNQAQNTNTPPQYGTTITLKTRNIVPPRGQQYFYGETATHNCQQQELYQSNQMRTRVTSIGSAANYQNLCSNNQLGQRCQCQNGCWHATCQQEMYLRPAYDKSAWQKSCSDSALHVPSQSTLATGELVNRSVCSENPLAMDIDLYNGSGNNNNNNNSNNNHENVRWAVPVNRQSNELIEEGRQRGVCRTVQSPAESFMEPTMRTNFNKATFEQAGDGSYLVNASESSIDPSASQQIIQHQQQQQPAALGETQCFGHLEPGESGGGNAQTTQQQQLYHQQGGVVANEVPGINICMIEDDGITFAAQLKLEANQQTCSSRDSSLPDISNLQFDINEEVANQSGLHSGEQVSLDSNGFQQQQQQLDAADIDYNVASQEWYSVDNRPKITNNRNQQVNDHPLSSSSRIDLTTAAATTTTPTSTTADWQLAKGENLCGLQLEHHQVANNECGLTADLDYDACLQNHQQFGGNIIRSHSHNSIEHYTTRQKLDYAPHSNRLLNQQPLATHNSVNISQQQQPEENHNQHYGMGQQLSEHQISIGQKFLVNNIGEGTNKFKVQPNSSIDPSSDGTSPQSEQNSPGSNMNEHNDTCLPCLSNCEQQHQQPSSNSLQQQQQQHQELYNHDDITFYSSPYLK